MLYLGSELLLRGQMDVNEDIWGRCEEHLPFSALYEKMYKQDKNKTEPLSLFQLVVGVGKFLEVPFFVSSVQMHRSMEHLTTSTVDI